MGEVELDQIISGCLKQDKKCQKLLYKAFYSFAMGICLRYAGNREEAAEVMNRGFLKIFNHINGFDTRKPFKAWLCATMVNVFIDFYHSNLKMAYTSKTDRIKNDALIDRKLARNDFLQMVQQLPLVYRIVFNLFSIDGYSHEEIAVMLNIDVGTSKNNLDKAREILKADIRNRSLNC